MVYAKIPKNKLTMKLIIASDIHGSAYWCRKLCDLMEEQQPDKLILLAVRQLSGM